jgi:Ca2+-binding EF-hand superfamily protein
MQNSWAKKASPKSQLILIERFKKELQDRGGRGLVGLRRQFKIFDTNGNGTLEFNEFKKAIEDYDINLHPKDVENLFKNFDLNGDGLIQYEEFLRTFIGQMPRVRYELTMKAFKRLDTDCVGEVSLQDLFGAYDASRHPDVITGKISAEDANLDFQEIFAMHHNTINDYNPNTPVTVDEFIDYYAYMSCMIDSDHVFDQMLTGNWHLDNMNNYYAGTSQLI